jgi:VWFA-related protein
VQPTPKRVLPYAAISTAVALSCLLGAPRGLVSAQQSSPVFRGGIDVVTVDVSVLDRNRRPVKGLTADDFTVLEDGKPQQIIAFNAFDVPDVTDTPTPTAPWLRDVAPDVVSNQREPRRIIVIVMDDARSSYEDVLVSRKVAHAAVDRLGPDDLAAVTFTDIGMRTNLTADRARLREAVNSFIAHPDGGFLGNVVQEQYRKERAALGGTTGGLPPPTCSYAGTSHGPGACTVEVMKSIAEALNSAPQGRKTVVWISRGIPRNLSMGNATGSRNPSLEVDEQNAMLRSFQEQNINIYAFDPCGPKCSPGSPSLHAFSEETGGRATVGTNTPEVGVPQVFVDSSSYYLLAFRSDNRTADGKFRRIQVKVNRPGVEVQTRSGYYAPLPEKARAAAKSTARPTVDRALSQGVAGSGLPLAMAVAPVAARSTSDATLAITVSLREALPPGRHRIELVTTAVDQACPICMRQTQRQSIELVSGASPSGEPYQVLSRLAVAPGHRYNVRVAANLDGRTGSVFADVDVPNFAKDRLSASGLVLSVVPGTVTGQRRVFTDVLPLLPSTTRDFSSGMAATAFIRLTQGGSNPLAGVRVAATIRNEHNGVDFERTTTLDASAFGAGRSADYRLDLPIAPLAPGPHVLTIEMSLGTSVVTRNARFAIR